jgi:FlgD Ig-like domain
MLKPIAGLILLGNIAWAQTVAQTMLRTPYNGGLSHPYNTSKSPFQRGKFTAGIPKTAMGFRFTFATAQRQTSAVVYNSSGVMIRTLWTTRGYPAGSFGDIWDGLDDYGVQAPAGTYTIHLTANNIKYANYGVVGDINKHEYSPTSWNLGFEEFPVDMASIGSTAFDSTGYTEGAFSCATFQLSNPIDDIHPCETASFGADIFSYIATDGKLFYFVDRGFPAERIGEGGIVAMDAQSNLHNFSAGTIFTHNFVNSSDHTGHFSNLLDENHPRYWIAQVADFSSFAVSPPTIVTGIAVERNGAVLASAHGSSNSSGKRIENTGTIKLLNKLTGAVLGTITVPGCDPHRMTFDLRNNLWVICGNGGIISKGVQTSPNNKIVKITGIGSTDASASEWAGRIVADPIAGLSNPMALAVSPVTGDLLVADGGNKQQVLEYNSSLALVRTLGTRGGYGTGTSCNATITNTKFWFDQGQTGVGAVFSNFVWPDDLGGLWVSDIGTHRILHYILAHGVWTYKDRQMYQPFERVNIMATNDPTKILGGQEDNGMIEFTVDYSKPPMEGDPDPAAGGTGWWTESYNWTACLLENPNYIANGSVGAPTAFDFWVNPSTGTPVIFYKTDGTKVVHRMIANPSGVPTVLLDSASSGAPIDPHGYLARDGGSSLWHSSAEVQLRTLAGYDADNGPVLNTVTSAGVMPKLNHSAGQPNLNVVNTYAAPTTSGEYALLDGNANTAAPVGSPRFHLAGVRVGTTVPTWMALAEADISEADGESHFPAADLTRSAQGGTMSYTIGNDIFAEFNGNGSAWGCQFWHYADDGTALGQFGYLPSIAPATTFQLGYSQNTPLGAVGQWKVPGYCGDQGQFKVERVGENYVTYIGDESYIHGIHLYMISNLSSVSRISSAGALGSTVTLQ